MTSAIDVTVPIYGNPTTKSVRDNFATAHDEIGALQTDVGTKVNRSGDTMTGFLSLYLDPELPTHAATKSYVDAMAFTGGGGAVAAQSVTVAPAIAGLPGANVYDALGSAFPKSGGTFTGPVSFNNEAEFSYNSASIPAQGQGGYIKWNVTPGHGDMGFINSYSNAGNAFTWLLVTGVGTWNELAHLSSSGTFTVNAVSLGRDPTVAGEAVTKQYVDTLYFPKSGGTLTGGISFGTRMAGASNDLSQHIALYDGWGGFNITSGALNVIAQGAVVATFHSEGMTIGGIGKYLMINAGANLYLDHDPTDPSHAATKQYVDSKSGGASLTVADTPPTIANGKMWFDSNKTQLYVGYDDGTSSQWVIANNPNTQQSSAALQPSYNNVGRNLIHNSMFNVQQRFGGPFAARSLFTADRWQMDFIGGTLSVSLPYLTDANRASIGDEFARYQMVLSFTGGSATGDETYLQQSIEGVTRTAGKTITVSFWAAATSGTPKFGVALYQLFGTGGSPSPTIFVSGQSVTLSTTYTRYTMIFTIPSMSGKTVGTNGNDCLLFRFAVSAGSTSSPSYGNIGVQTGQIGIWGVQLEIGNTATPLEKPDPQIDLANCQRFYQKGFFDFGIYGLAANSASSGFSFPVQMRATPTVTTSGVTFFNSSGLVTTAWSNSWLSVGYVITANGMTRTYGEFQASADL